MEACGGDKRIDRGRGPVARGGRAFTLIELLVVVAIIALLVSILLPSLGQARRQGRLAKCLSNMRQISLAVRMYLGDHRDVYPSTMEVATTGFPETVNWWAVENYQKALEAYIRQDRGGVDEGGATRGKDSVWFDPSDPDTEQPAMWGSFSDNGIITGAPRRDNEIRNPADTVYTTLRHADWAAIVGVTPPSPLPLQNPADPFWASEYFDMCFDPWSESDDPADPYHWARGRATPPAALFPNEPGAATWDEQIDGRNPNHPQAKPRYGRGQPYAFVDGHAAMHTFEETYAFPDLNWWDIW